MSAIRQDRLNEEIKKAVSEIIFEMKDPRVSSMATITQAEVTNDLKQAKLRVSVYEQD
ncbi:MAG TPA: ribosome-binding factor A, partial [Clostridia bacterium]|nr:ribosome-binding factor A [Clostridia bacterium]